MSKSSTSSPCLICLKAILQIKSEDWEHVHGSAGVDKSNEENFLWFINFCKNRLQMQLSLGFPNSSQTTTECGLENHKQHLNAFTSLFCEDCRVLVISVSKICAELDTLEAKLLAKLNEMGVMIANSKMLVSCNNELMENLSVILNVGDVEVLDQFRVDLMKKCNQKARKLFPKVVLTPVSLNSVKLKLTRSSFKPRHRNSTDHESVNEDLDDMDNPFCDTMSDPEWSPDNEEPAPGVSGKTVEVNMEQRRISKPKKHRKRPLNRKRPKKMKVSNNNKDLAQRHSPILLQHCEEKSYDCKTCMVKFSRKCELIAHKKETGHYIVKQQIMTKFVKITGREEKCLECETEFTDPVELYEHQVNSHKGGPDNLSFTCSLCPTVTFENCKDLIHHLTRSHEKNADTSKTENLKTRKFYCALCPNSFRTFQTFELHKRFVHWNQPIYFCDDESCLNPFKSPEEQYSHMTGPVHEHNEVFQCDLCQMGYFSSGRLSLHKFVHADTIKVRHGKRFTCPLKNCSKESPQWHVIMYHHNFRHHTGLKALPTPRCDVCGECCISVPELESHVRWKHSEKDIPFENISCEACENGETYPTLREYIFHYLTDGHKKFVEKKKRKWREGDESEDDFEGVEEKKVKVCPYANCDRKFVFYEKFARHRIRKHKKDRLVASDNVICEDCGKVFTPRRLLQHKTDVHSEPLECSACGKKFQTRHTLKVHVARAHSERTIPCEKCGKMFAETRMLRLHMKNHDRRYKCHLCPASFRDGSQFHAHMKKHD